ncbi:hypothetical protein [Qipengyuania marisflavi]|uniref:DUF3617 family protein n=1 Tax=Qipengyuania marisflavi TaxID=2486356 RepID=A0A5S3P4Y4_9SPHN|nr:hypothetical protein [Qipengyuania marisflavi]TMM48099.1 hypothetical protein FEV51_07280 [Qipengyuania marisflavi]
MSSRRWPVVAIAMLFFPLHPASAQELSQDGAQGEPPERIDLLASTAREEQGPEYERCTEEQEAAAISGEIVVCRRRTDNTEYGYDKERAARRYAQETMYEDSPQTPDVAGAGIFRGPATISGMCIPGLQKCPPPPAYMIDFSTLPDAPPGSDADRISRGLPPLGRDVATPGAVQVGADQLGLPPANSEDAAVSPSESASPAAEPSG